MGDKKTGPSYFPKVEKKLPVPTDSRILQEPTLKDKLKFELFLAYLSDFKMDEKAKRKLAARLLDHKGLRDHLKKKKRSQEIFKEDFVKDNNPRAYLQPYLKVIGFVVEADLTNEVGSADKLDEIVKKVKKYIGRKDFNLLAEHQVSVKLYLTRLIGCLETLQKGQYILQDTKYRSAFLLKKQIEIIQELHDELQEGLTRGQKETMLKLAFDQTALSYRIFETVNLILKETTIRGEELQQFENFISEHSLFDAFFEWKK